MVVKREDSENVNVCESYTVRVDFDVYADCGRRKT